MRFLSSGNSSQMISACLDNISRFQGDNSTVGVGNQAMRVSSSIGVVSIGENMAKLSKVSSTCSSNSRGVSRYHSSVGESHESSVGDCHAGGKNQKLHVDGWV